MAGSTQATRFRFWLWLIRVIGVIVPRRLRRDWRKEWEAELSYREAMLANWERLDWRHKVDLLWRSTSAFWDALWLQPQRLEDEMFQDLRYGMRTLAKNPGLTAVAVLTLSLGIGLVTIQLSFINGVLLKGLPFERSERIMLITRVDPEGKTSIPLTEFFAAREQQNSFSVLAALDDREPLNISGEGIDARAYAGAGFSAAMLPLLGVQPVLGRGFEATDEQPDAPPVVLLSYRVWLSDFGADPNIVGRPIRLNGEPATIIGVMPAGFAFPVNEAVWVNLRPPTRPADDRPGVRARADLIGRLKNDATLAGAQAEFGFLIRPTKAFATSDAAQTPHVQIVPYFEAMTEGGVKIILLSLLGVVGCVLGLACLNVANLLSARALQRGRELAVRAALGARRGRLVRQMLTESCLLAVLGALGGVVLAIWGVQLFNRALAFDERPFWFVVDLDYRVLVATASLMLAVGVLTGLFPALRATRGDVGVVLKDSAHSASSFRLGRFNRGLVIIQTSVSCTVLIATSVLVDSVRRVVATDLPFDPEAVLCAQVRHPVDDDAAQLSFQLALLDRLRTLPGVKAATITASYPFARLGSSPVEVMGAATAGNAEPTKAFINSVAAGFFHDLQLPLYEGRDFAESDDLRNAPVAIVTESFARRFWPGESALGKQVRSRGAASASPQPWMTVIGVAADLSNDKLWNRLGLHVPMRQAPRGRATLLLTAEHNPRLLIRPLRDAVQTLSVDTPVEYEQTLGERMQELVRPFPAIARLCLAFGVSGLLLAAIGIYGVASFGVQRRTHEFGIRRALGAQPSDVLALVFKQAVWQLSLGLGVGAFFGWVGSQPLLGIVSTFAEPPGTAVYVFVVAVITLVMLLALWLPARRAARVNPLDALRQE